MGCEISNEEERSLHSNGITLHLQISCLNINKSTPNHAQQYSISYNRMKMMYLPTNPASTILMSAMIMISLTYLIKLPVSKFHQFGYQVHVPVKQTSVYQQETKKCSHYTVEITLDQVSGPTPTHIEKQVSLKKV